MYLGPVFVPRMHDKSVNNFVAKTYIQKSSFILLSSVLTAASLSGSIPLISRSALAAPREVIAQNQKKVEITLVSYAVTKVAFDKIIPKFTADWKKKTGQDVTIKSSYGGSGSQTRAVIDGLQADVIALALASDHTKIQKAGLIKPGWEKEAPNNAIVTTSVIALETRDGNPKKIQNWKDLARSGVSVITANPQTSGGAKWNFLGIWGAEIRSGKNEAQARNFATQVYKNVPILPKDAREASDTFYKKKQGDVLINYENEVILAAQRGQTKPSYVIPSPNIKIEGPVAVVDTIVDKRGTRKVSEAFVSYLFTPDSQRQFASVGFRPVNSTVAKEVGGRFPKVSNLFTVKDLGGWDSVDKKFFSDGGVFGKIIGAGK